MNKQLRLLCEWALLLLASLVLVVVAQQRGWTDRIDLQMLDLEAWINNPDIDPSLIVVEIDDLSLEEVGTWPWGRDQHALLIERLAAKEPRAIGIDILFIEPGEAQTDTALAQAIAESGTVILPHSFAPRPNISSGEIPLLPLPELVASAQRLGHVALTPDSDGITRRFQLLREGAEENYPHFAAAIASFARGEESEVNEETIGKWFGLPSPIIRYDADAGFQTAQASRVMDGSIPGDFFRNRIVLLGATAPGLGDRYAVPDYAGRLMSGVQMQAHLISAILQDDLIRPAPSWIPFAIQLSAIVALFMAFWQLPPRATLMMAIAIVATLLLVTFAALGFVNLWIPVGPALLAIFIAYPLWGWRRLASVSRFLHSEAMALRKAAGDLEKEPQEGFDIVAQQVSLLKRLTGEVSRNLELVQDILNASPDAMLVIGADENIMMTNAPAKHVFGSIQEGNPVTLSALIASVHGSWDEERGEITLADGRVFWLAESAIEPTIGSKVLALRDVTELKLAEQQRRETLEFLSHDMRSPQVAIIGLAGKSGANLEHSERLERIDMQARRTLKLTDDFVQIARIENDGIQREECELNSVIHEATDRAFPLAHKKKIKIAFDETGEPGFAEIDQSAIARMLDNLLGNAIKFAPDGSKIELSLDVSSADIFVIEISDQGPGLPPERKATPFARFGARETTAGPSAGLGLAYVKQVVDQHDGTIAIDSEAGKGTRFTITLPYG